MADTINGQLNGGATCWISSTYQVLIALAPLQRVLRAHIRSSQQIHVARAALVAATHKLFPSFARPCVCPPNMSADAPIFAHLCALPERSLYSFAQIPQELWRDWRAPCVIYALTAREEPANTAALRLFCALVLYCARAKDGPWPEYNTMGEVSLAMLGMILRAIDSELGTHEASALFEIGALSKTLCATCAMRAHSAQQTHWETPRAEEREMAIGLHVIPPLATQMSTSVQMSLEISERECTNACGNPGLLGIEMRAHFSEIIAISTDDIIARAQQAVTSSTTMYRRRADIPIKIPRTMVLNSDGKPARYRLVAEILQEGGHITAICARGQCAPNRGAIYANDTRIEYLRDMPASMTACMLFYVRESAHDLPEIVTTMHDLICALSAECAISSELAACAQSISPVSGCILIPLASEEDIATRKPRIPREVSWEQFHYALLVQHICATQCAPHEQVMRELQRYYFGAEQAKQVARHCAKNGLTSIPARILASWRAMSDMPQEARRKHFRDSLESATSATSAMSATSATSTASVMSAMSATSAIFPRRIALAQRAHSRAQPQTMARK